MLYDETWAVPHIISILIAAGFLVAAIYKPLLARKLYAGLFVYASLVNASVALFAPQSYVGNARFALFAGLRDFIRGWFAQHVGPMVGAIALCQGLMAAGLILGGTYARLALMGAIAFFVGIAPLGVGSAFPATLIWAAGAAWLLFNPHARAQLERSLPRLYAHGVPV